MKTIFACFAVALATPALAQNTAPNGDAARGQKTYMADGCYQCHGTVGQGSRGTGPRLAPNPAPYEAFVAQLRHPSNIMPPYTALVLPDAQVADIYAYMKSLPGPAKAEDAPILQH